MKIVYVMALIAAPALADTCPPVADHTDALATLVAAANAAPDERAGRAVSDQMWQIWLRAPDAAAQAALDQGMRQRSSYDFAGAYDSFDRLVAYCPDYAEGYNQRAFISYLREDYAAAVADLDIALALLPNHVGAQSGRALALMQMGQLDAARAQLVAALANNPWLSERHLLAKGAPLAPKGEDI
mmetsp:Transcript_29536/g.58028  ORF Transcript_29536/g.58028 Transcript_29536/m.58028 type:complete len:185 (-) Transcript_29536:1332-1886(-)